MKLGSVSILYPSPMGMGDFHLEPKLTTRSKELQQGSSETMASLDPDDDR